MEYAIFGRTPDNDRYRVVVAGPHENDRYTITGARTTAQGEVLSTVQYIASSFEIAERQASHLVEFYKVGLR